MDRFYVDTEGDDDEAVREGWAWLLDTAAQQGASSAAIVIPRVSMIEYLASALGADRGRRFQKDRQLVESGITVKLLTESRPMFGRGPALALWLTPGALDSLDDSRDLTALCVVPVAKQLIAYWTDGRRPVEIRTGLQTGTDIPLDVVAVAMTRQLGIGLNMQGVPYPLKMDRAKATLMALRAARASLKPEQIRSQALRLGASASDAAELARLAAKADRGVKLRFPKGQAVPPEKVETWFEEADTEDDQPPRADWA